MVSACATCTGCRQAPSGHCAGRGARVSAVLVWILPPCASLFIFACLSLYCTYQPDGLDHLCTCLQLVMYTAGLGNNTSDSSAAGSGEGHESLEQLSANALLQLLKLADATQQLAALFKVIPLEDGSFPPEDQQVGNVGQGCMRTTSPLLTERD